MFSLYNGSYSYQYVWFSLKVVTLPFIGSFIGEARNKGNEKAAHYCMSLSVGHQNFRIADCKPDNSNAYFYSNDLNVMMSQVAVGCCHTILFIVVQYQSRFAHTHKKNNSFVDSDKGKKNRLLWAAWHQPIRVGCAFAQELGTQFSVILSLGYSILFWKCFNSRNKNSLYCIFCFCELCVMK